MLNRPQSLYDDDDGEFYVTCQTTARGATRRDPYPIQKFMIVTHEPWERSYRINRETAACLSALSRDGEAVMTTTALHILDKFDVWGSYQGDYRFKVSKDNTLIVYLGEKVEPVMLGEVSNLEEAIALKANANLEGVA